MPPIATVRGTPVPTRPAGRRFSLTAELLQRGLERPRVIELLGLPFALGAGQASRRHLEGKVRRGSGALQPVDAAIGVYDFHHVAQLLFELRIVHALEDVASLAHPEFRICGAAAMG